MPWFLLIAGIVLIVAAYRKKHGELFSLLKDDFFGDNNFIMWTLAIVLIVAAGQIKKIRPITDALLGLVILVIIVRNYRDGKDLLTMFIEQVKGGTGDVATGIHSSGQSMIKSIGGVGANVAQNVLSQARERLKGILK